jgi:hypothetical protein
VTLDALGRAYKALVVILLGLAEPRLREKIVSFIFAQREYAPLPTQIRERIISKATSALQIDVSAFETRKSSSIWRILLRALRLIRPLGWTNSAICTASAETYHSSE